MNPTTRHANLVKQIIKGIAKKFPDVIALEFDAGFARAYHDPEITFQYGTPGYPDITVIMEKATWLGLEAKTGNATFSKRQNAFAKRVKDVGGEVVKVKSVKDAIEAITRKKNELS